jgi:hypothetical protein
VCPLAKSLLVDAHLNRNLFGLACLSANHRSLHQVVSLVPAQAQSLRGAGDVRLLEHVDREPLKQEREPRTSLRPRHRHLAHAMGRAFHSRHTRVEQRRELARVQVTPDPLLRVVVKTRHRPAVRTRKRSVRSMLRPYVHLVLLHRKLNFRDRPRRLKPKDVPVQLRVSHHPMLHAALRHSEATEKSEEPETLPPSWWRRHSQSRRGRAGAPLPRSYWRLGRAPSSSASSRRVAAQRSQNVTRELRGLVLALPTGDHESPSYSHETKADQCASRIHPQ